VNPPKRNPWFSKAAKLLSMNSKINVQKSYWRLRENLYSTGELKNTAAVIKLQKIFYIVGKYYNYNILKAFYSLVNFGKNRMDQMDVSKLFRERYERDSEGLPRDTLELAEYSRVAVSEVDYPTGNNQMNGARMAMRVFKRNLIKQVRSWQDNALPENRLKRLNEEVKEYPKNFINLASKFGAL
jgi:hypothetical protein